MKNYLKKGPVKYGILAVLLIGLTASGISIFKNGNGEESQAQELSKEVKTQIIQSDSVTNGKIETVGTVEADTSVDVISTSAGTLRSLFFDIGDEVALNQSLARLDNSSTLTGLNNAQTNLNNSQSSLQATERITTESIAQAQIGVEQAEVGVRNSEQAIVSAELAIKSAEDNLKNAEKIQEKRVSDLKNSAVISFNGYLNTIFNAMDQVADLIKADQQGVTLSSTLGAKDPETINRTKASYLELETIYKELSAITAEPANIENTLRLTIEGLNTTEQMLSNTIKLLDASVTGTAYPESLLNSQKSAFISLRTAVVQSQNTAKSESQALSTIAISNASELEGLKNAIRSAENQLSIAKTARDNALVSLKNAEQSVTNAKEAREQQLLGSQTQIDNARGQLNLSQSQAGDLNIKAPIPGKITGKYVEVGAELSPGQRIAQISQLKRLKIVVNLSSQDIYRVSLGQSVYIEDDLEAKITSINPSADPVSKKVKVEISFDNSENQLIQGTFVDVSIPVEKIERSQENSVFVPLRAVTITQNESFVFVNKDGIAKKVRVEIGKSENALLEILSGLNYGDELIIDGAKLLQDGDEIIIK